MVLRFLRQIIHELTRVFMWVYVKPRFHYRLEQSSDRLPAPPYVVIANHGTFFDPWIVGVFSLCPFSYMCNDDAFRASPFVRWYLGVIGAFPKKKGAQDYRAMKEMLRRLRGGTPVCIFPEGQTTWDGRTQLIYKGLEKVVRRARVPLVIYRLCGNFLTRPWWAQSWRQGRVLVSIRALSVDDIDSTNDEELFAAMKNGIAHNDIRDPRNDGVFSGSDLALGVERLLWLCPECRSHDRLGTEGNHITCSGCGSVWRMDAQCRLLREGEGAAGPRDLVEWEQLQQDAVATVVAADGEDGENAGELTRSEGVFAERLDPDGSTFTAIGTGLLILNRDRLCFTPSDGGEEQLFRLSECGDYVIQRKDIFEFRCAKTWFRIHFVRRSPMKWVWYCRYLSGYAESVARGWL